MSTRGIVGVRINGVDKLSYNHCDSYPSALGLNVLTFVRSIVNNKRKYASAKRASEKLVLVFEGDAPTSEFVEKFKKHCNLGVASGRPNDMYCLLRELQGDLSGILKAGVMLDFHEFINDSLFCQWAYIVNFDTLTLEVYRGSQKHAHKSGRYASSESTEDGYYPCALTLSVALVNLPTDELFCSALCDN